jgi:predicted porin
MPSSDLGFITYIKPNEKIGFDFALTNGEGFRFDQDNYGDVKLAAGFDYNPIKGLQTRVFYDYLKSKDPLKPAEQQLFSIFAGYKLADKFRLGAEYNYRKNHLNVSNQDLFGYSIYGTYHISRRFEYFLRYDNLSSNKKTNQTQVWNYNADGQGIITGLHFSPVTNINVSINYQGFIPENSDLNLQHHILFSFEYKL